MRFKEGTVFGVKVENETGIRMDGMRNLRRIETAMAVEESLLSKSSRIVVARSAWISSPTKVTC